MYNPQRNVPNAFGNPVSALGSKILGYVSIVLGAFSIIIGLIPFINLFAIVSGIIGLIIGFIAMKQAAKGRATAKYAIGGIVLSIIGIILSFVINSAVLDKITGDDDKQPANERPATDY